MPRTARALADGDLSRWMHWLLTAQVRRYQRHYHATGHVWQGRFKAFPIQDDDHLLVVLRYVERNPLHAGLVGRAEAWEWSSLHGHAQGPLALWLDPGPVPRGPQWVEAVNAPMFETELWGFRGHHTESSGDEHGVPGTPDAGSTPRHPSRD